MALHGVKCRGFATRQAREEDYCGCARRPLPRPRTHARTRLLAQPRLRVRADWDSEVNPLAAEPKQRRGLLAVGPYCMSEAGAPAYCSPQATRTQRSGITDVEYMNRPDREYWPVCCNSNHARARARACACHT